MFFIGFSHGIFSQKLTLDLASKDAEEVKFLQSLNFKKLHLNKTSIYKELELVAQNIKTAGYFTAILDSISTHKNKYTAFYSLGRKTAVAQLSIKDASKTNQQNIKIEKLAFVLDSINNNLENKGSAFSEVKLSNINIKNDTLFAVININKAPKRTINKVIVKGYEKFPKSFIKHYLKINPKKTFNKDNVQEISDLTKSLSFVEEIKPPETLFTTDSTFLYLYLRKKKNNSIDALVNFANKNNNSGLLFNGNIDLKLNNIFNAGEELSLFWNKIANQNSQLNISVTYPYLFNSSVKIRSDFNLYRQDSSFVNTSFLLEAGIPINRNSITGIGYKTSSSNSLKNNVQNQLDFNTNFLTVFYEYNSYKPEFVFSKKYSFLIQPSIGNRKTDLDSQSQYSLKIAAHYIFEFSSTAYLYTKSVSELLKSTTYLTNELFRIGGANSIRGFNEQSIFTNRYSYANIEFRFVTSNTDYLYTISDLGIYNDLQTGYQFIQGFGFGYSFQQKNNYINLGYALGIQSNEKINLNNSKLIISFKSYF